MPRLALWCALVLLVTGCTLTTPAPTPMPTPDLPRVRFLFPENNAQIYEGAEINVDILAEDESAGIASVAFYVDGVKINEGSPTAVVPAFRAQMNWVASGVGGHTLQAIALRPDGTSSPEQVGVNLILVEVVPQP
ncbi:MAG: Ig-like domain-containing protein [Anaerolineae bacterium]|jgi:hypothetical protein|nr:Ig-like domain-containing protein [Anaerolineae bacterium]